jgi:hypothetical protein
MLGKVSKMGKISICISNTIVDRAKNRLIPRGMTIFGAILRTSQRDCDANHFDRWAFLGEKNPHADAELGKNTP